MTYDRVVFDTNGLISGALSTESTPARALEKALTEGQLLASRATLRELMEKLLSPKFDRDVSREKREALLLRLAPLVEIVDRETLPREVQQNIDMESYRIQQTGSGKIALERKPGVLDPVGTKATRTEAPEELETLSRIIAELNERFGLNLGPEHRVTLGQMMEKLDEDAALDAAARVNTRENVRLTFDQKVEHVIQEIVDSNFDLYKRITDDRAFGEAVKNLLFDQYLRAHRSADDLIKRGESKTLAFLPALRWNHEENRQDEAGVTHAVLATIAAFLNTEGGDLLIGAAGRSVTGIEHDGFQTDDAFVRHLTGVVRTGLGERAGTCVDPRVQVVQGKSVCVVSCQRNPEPVFLKWEGVEAAPEGDFFVRSGPGTVSCLPETCGSTSGPDSVRARRRENRENRSETANSSCDGGRVTTDNEFRVTGVTRSATRYPAGARSGGSRLDIDRDQGPSRDR